MVMQVAQLYFLIAEKLEQNAQFNSQPCNPSNSTRWNTQAPQFEMCSEKLQTFITLEESVWNNGSTAQTFRRQCLGLWLQATNKQKRRTSEVEFRKRKSRWIGKSCLEFAWTNTKISVLPRSSRACPNRLRSWTNFFYLLNPLKYLQSLSASGICQWWEFSIRTPGTLNSSGWHFGPFTACYTSLFASLKSVWWFSRESQKESASWMLVRRRKKLQIRFICNKPFLISRTHHVLFRCRCTDHRLFLFSHTVEGVHAFLA